MPDGTDWSVTTFEGNRRRHHEEFRALPLREKVARIEEMGEVAELFAARCRSARGAPDAPQRTAADETKSSAQ